MRRPFPVGLMTQLGRIVGNQFVYAEGDIVEKAARDETPNLLPVLPDVVVRPNSTAEISEIMRLCSEHGVYVTPRGAGTGKSGGCIPVYGGVVLQLDRMTRINEIDEGNLIARAEPGVVLETFLQATEEKNLFYPPDPASLQWCTLGGNVAENAGGPRALKYGVTGTYILGLEAVLPDGTVVNTGKSTMKGVAGYDLTSLLVGSEGTLAVITNITVKLLPNPRFVHTALCNFPSSQAATAAVSAVLAGGILPRTLEYLDRASIEAVRRLGTATYRFPDNAGAALIIETDGDSETGTFEALERALGIIEKAGATEILLAQDVRQQRMIWQSRRLLSEATRKMRKRKVSEDIVIPRTKIPEMVAYVDMLGEKYNLGTCSFGHAGDGNLHMQVMFDEEGDMPRVEMLLDEMFRATIRMGGTITGEHGVGLAKKPYLLLEQSPQLLDLQRRVKAAFDPAGILNPGKFLS